MYKEYSFYATGTPSLSPPYIVPSLLDTIQRYSKIDDQAEITMEVNPTSTEAEKLR